MPLFGKSKTKSDEKKAPASGSPYPTQYPTQAGALPAAPAHSAPPSYESVVQAGHQASYQNAPYNAAGAPRYPPQGAYGYAQPPAGYAQPPAGYAQPPAGYYQPPAGYYQPAVMPNIVGYGQFDAGARFNGGATVNVPPPPPGCMPNAAQIAAMNGGHAIVSQNPSNVLEGGVGSGGGVSWGF